jgi:hypothetical protein
MLTKIISAKLYNPKVELDIDVPTGKIQAFRVLGKYNLLPNLSSLDGCHNAIV